MDERMDILRKYNLWTEGDFDFGFMRVAYTGRIMDYVGNRLVKVLIGQRRTGKSYVLRQIARELIRNGVPPQNTLFINRELSDFAFLKIHKDLEELVALYKKRTAPSGKDIYFHRRSAAHRRMGKVGTILIRRTIPRSTSSLSVAPTHGCCPVSLPRCFPGDTSNFRYIPSAIRSIQ